MDPLVGINSEPAARGWDFHCDCVLGQSAARDAADELLPIMPSLIFYDYAYYAVDYYAYYMPIIMLMGLCLEFLCILCLLSCLLLCLWFCL